MKFKGICIHHSLTKDGKVVDYDAIKKYHVQQMGWNDIGYHFVIERQGNEIFIIEGRPLNQEGAHCKGHNDQIGICVVGNYDVETLEEEKLEALVSLTKNLINMFGFEIKDIHRHNEYAKKTCPGTKFPWVEFISKLK